MSTEHGVTSLDCDLIPEISAAVDGLLSRLDDSTRRQVVDIPEGK